MDRERAIAHLSSATQANREGNLAALALSMGICPAGLVGDWTLGPIAMEGASAATRMPVTAGGVDEMPMPLAQAIQVVGDRRNAEQMRRLKTMPGAGEGT